MALTEVEAILVLLIVVELEHGLNDKTRGRLLELAHCPFPVAMPFTEIRSVGDIGRGRRT